MSPRGEQRPVSVAPMLDHTDRHFRWLMRQLTRRALLYTEMVVGQSIRYGDRERLLGYDPLERPLALQLGGDEPELLAECARIAEDLGYDEVNLNVGCPSDRVRSGCFGAVLMQVPERVAEIVAAMRAKVAIPVTVKHRIGVDTEGWRVREGERYAALLRFVDTVAAAGCDRFVVHARIAVLGGLSPKENREVPPLHLDLVHALKRDRPGLRIEVNGGLRSLDAVAEQLDHVDGAMIGRIVIDRPLVLAGVDRRFYGDDRGAVDAETAREALLDAAVAYLERMAELPGFRPRWVTRHLLALYAETRGASAWRRTLSAELDAGAAGIAAARTAARAVAAGPVTDESRAGSSGT